MGLEQAGMTTVFQCEIDKHCQQTLNYHWPDVPKWDDVTTLTGEYILQHTDGIDVVAWGSPCQDLSVAGKRAGLEGDPSYTLDSISQHGVATEMQVRRLTPIECERLMGWPDNHTLPRADGKQNSDTNRYKMCGNGVATPVAKWIGQQIVRIHTETP